MSDLFSLKNEIAVVLGGTGVLGGGMADALAAAGATVAVVGRNAERGNERVDAIKKAGGRAIFQAADATSREGLVAARDAIEKQLGPTSILINATGGNRPDATLPPGADFCKLPIEAWQGVFDLNLVAGVLLPSQVFGESMLKAGRGSIINIASMSGMIPLSRVVAYSAAKAAVLNLTKFLAREWATKGIRVNAISPGFFPAEQNRALALQGRRQLHRTRRADHRPHAHGPLRQGRRTGRRGRLARRGKSVVVRHRSKHRRRRRLFVRDDLMQKEWDSDWTDVTDYH